MRRDVLFAVSRDSRGKSDGALYRTIIIIWRIITCKDLMYFIISQVSDKLIFSHILGYNRLMI